jgi:hypothetical protein
MVFMYVAILAIQLADIAGVVMLTRKSRQVEVGL